MEPQVRAGQVMDRTSVGHWQSERADRATRARARAQRTKNQPANSARGASKNLSSKFKMGINKRIKASRLTAHTHMVMRRNRKERGLSSEGLILRPWEVGVVEETTPNTMRLFSKSTLGLFCHARTLTLWLCYEQMSSEILERP